MNKRRRRCKTKADILYDKAKTDTLNEFLRNIGGTINAKMETIALVSAEPWAFLEAVRELESYWWGETKIAVDRDNQEGWLRYQILPDVRMVVQVLKIDAKGHVLEYDLFAETKKRFEDQDG